MLTIIILILLTGMAIAIMVTKKPSFAKLGTLLVMGISFIISCVILKKAIQGETMEFVLGNPPWNISLNVGILEALMMIIFTGVGTLILWASVSMIDHDVETKRIPLYYTLMCSLIMSLIAVVCFNNIFNVFIFIELSSFAAAGIVIIKNHKDNLRAGLKYLSLSILGSSLVLMGVVILYSLTGSLEYLGIHAKLIANYSGNETMILIALFFISIGVFFKSALFPFHIWLPDAHGTAPSPSSALLSSLVLKAYIIFYIKMLYVAVGKDILAMKDLPMLSNFVLILGVVAMLSGSIMAILQIDIKRMIAYSSVAQIGYIFMGIGLGTKLGLFAAIFHIVAHAVTKSGLFLEAGSIIEQTHNRDLRNMNGLAYQMPITIAMFTIGGLSMVGIPLFIGFNSKWNFAMGIMDSQRYWILAALAISSLLNALYYLPVVIRALFGEKAIEEKGKESVERPLQDLLPIIILTSMVIGLAVWSGPLVNIIDQCMNVIW